MMLHNPVTTLMLLAANWIMLGFNVWLLLRTRKNLKLAKQLWEMRNTIPPIHGMRSDDWQ